MIFKHILIAATLVPSAVSASSPGEWAGFNAKVAKNCEIASGLRRARSGQIVGFDDTLGKVVTLVTGMSPQSRQRPRFTTILCVYDQRSGRTWTSEARGWQSPNQPPRY
jgi:hypothetical protein